MIELVIYITEDGKAPFADWFDSLDTAASLKVRTALARIETGNLGDVKPVGAGGRGTTYHVRTGLSCLLWPRWRQAGDLALWRNEETPVKGHRTGQGLLG